MPFLIQTTRATRRCADDAVVPLYVKGQRYGAVVLGWDPTACATDPPVSGPAPDGAPRARSAPPANDQVVLVAELDPPGGAPPGPPGAPAGRRSDAHAWDAVWNFLLLSMLRGKIPPLPEKLGAGRV